MGALEVRFKAKAGAHISHIYTLYEAEDAGLGQRFLQAVDKAVERIALFPKSCPIFHRETRRVPLNRFPYSVYFREYTDHAAVVAVLHAKRDPSYQRSQSE